MFVWLVTVRAADGGSLVVTELLRERLLPVLRSQPACVGPTLARCVNCAGESTFLAYWNDRAALEAFEDSPAYRALLRELTPHLRLPPKRELWEVLAG